MGMLVDPGRLRNDLHYLLEPGRWSHAYMLHVPEDTCWDIATAADGDHEVWLEVIEDPGC